MIASFASRATFGFSGLSAFILAGAMMGCSGSSGESIVTGTLTANGKPVNAGTLNIVPAGGAGASGSSTISARVASDGSFKTVIGVPAGKAMLTYVEPGPAFPEGYVPKASEPAPESPYRKMVVKDQEVTITGKTVLTVELISKGK